jgi:hypothetical protein
MRPVFFNRPESSTVELRLDPRLASWNRSDHRDQVELRQSVESAEEQLRGVALNVDGPLALRLDVGLQAGLPLLEFRDLDNYAYPLAAHLRKTWKRPLASIWATKAVAPTSHLRCAAAHEKVAPDLSFVVETTAPSDSRSYKEQVAESLPDAPLPDGPVAVELAFVVSPARNWLNLWKPTIDALGKLLGSSGTRPWNPQDGRITELGLHCAIDPLLGSHVRIGISARSVEGAR